jgi:hypothetical protein
LDSLAALEKIEGYNPYKKELTLENIKRVKEEMFGEQNAKVQMMKAYQARRDNACAKEWELHNLVLDSKTTVAAIFGKSSNEVQSMGLKKKTEYKTGTGRPKKA